MLIIPVIDIKGGQAVRAIAGIRSRYQPITTELCDGSSAKDLLEAYLGLYPFPIIYLADLDAIMNRGSNRALIDALTAHRQQPEFWLDAGFDTPDKIAHWKRHDRLRIVLGSESLPSADAYTTLRTACRSEPILSLDFKCGQFLGPAALRRRPTLWPADVIYMTLDRVGGGRGPSIADEQPFGQDETRRRFAAGGVRGMTDLRRLKSLGWSGVLVASALLDGRLGTAGLAEISGK